MAKQRKTSRRDFLRGQSAVEALHDVADQIGAGDSLDFQARSNAGYWLRFGRRAMACEFEILIDAKRFPGGPECAVECLDLVEQLEAQLTVYRDDSEVSQINQMAADRPIEVEPRLFALFELAAEIWRETDGAFDITAGPLAKCWGFYRRAGKMPDEIERRASLARVGMQHVALDRQKATVQFRQAGVEINLGSIGKGYALDRVAEQLESASVPSFLLHGGNSSMLARGASEDTADADGRPLGWWIGLRHPLRPDRRIGQVLLQDRALGTSGSGTQFFIYQGRRYGHIIDPRTGWPAQDVLSTTVVAPTGAEADALATAFYVMGQSAIADFCRDHPQIGAVVMMPGDARGTVEVSVHNLRPDQVQFEKIAGLRVREREC